MMNKFLHALVYIILALTIVALVFEINLFNKRELLGNRNRLMEDYIVRIAKTIEQEDAAKPAVPPEVKKDTSPVEAKALETPETENLLEEYPAQLEQQNLPTFSWDNAKSRLQLRAYYLLGPDGKPIPDAANYNRPMTVGAGTMTELLVKLFDRSQKQQANLNSTRSALADVRAKLEANVNELNRLKQEDRADKVTIEEQKAKIAQLESDKADLEAQVAKLKQQIEELNGELVSVRDELQRAKDETEAVKEELAKEKKKSENLMHLLQAQRASNTSNGRGTVGAPLTIGDKGKLVEVNNELMYVIIAFSDSAMKELLGNERDGALPQLELAVKRIGFQGAAGEFIGHLRLRIAVQDKNFVVADILGDWQQAPMEKGDVVFME